jgi:hypothetical protein
VASPFGLALPLIAAALPLTLLAAVVVALGAEPEDGGGSVVTEITEDVYRVPLAARALTL